ncbi:MAG: hypothetical protein AAGG44_20735, partial [Planctomycetota bacterium]
NRQRAIQALSKDDYPFVLCWRHCTGNFTWQRMKLPLVDTNTNISVRSRMIEFDFVLETDLFRQTFEGFQKSLNVVQINSVPPDHLDLHKVEGSERYRLLDQIGWRFLIQVPGARDFAFVASPDKSLVQKAISITTIDA